MNDNVNDHITAEMVAYHDQRKAGAQELINELLSHYHTDTEGNGSMAAVMCVAATIIEDMKHMPGTAWEKLGAVSEILAFTVQRLALSNG